MFSLEQYQALRERVGSVERDDVGRLWIRGEDRRSYLHNLLTNDIEGLAAGQVRYAALLTPQGRMVTDLHVFERGDAVLATVPRALAGSVAQRLDGFIFSEDVQVEDATAATVQFGVYGPLAEGVVEQLPPGLTMAVIAADEFGLAGFELIAAADDSQRLRDALAIAGAIGVDMAAAEVCRIEAGIPRFLQDMTEDTIPLEAGIEDRAISLTKGCYVGQEIIIRILHRGGGRVARRLMRIGFPDTSAVPPPGTRLRTADRDLGWITSSAHSPAFGGPLALGYVHREFAEPGTSIIAAVDSGVEAQGKVLAR